MTEPSVKTRRDKVLEQLQNLAETVKVEDIRFVVAQERNVSTLDNDKPRLTAQANKFQLARQIPENNDKLLSKNFDGRELEGVNHQQTRKIQQHITDFKAKGKLENFRLRQALRRWRAIAQEITKKHQEEEIGFRDEDNGFKLKILRDDIGKQIKENLIKQRDFMIKTDDKPKIKNMAPRRQEEIISEIKKQSQEPGPDLKRFIPFCNNIVLLNVQKKPQK